MTDKKQTKRVMTSAIPSMSVAEVRRCLAHIRKFWKHSTTEAPFLPSIEILPGQSIEEFALHFVRGHHDKRHNKK